QHGTPWPASIVDGAFLSRSRSMRRRLAPILEARRSPVRGILRALGEIAIMTKYLQVCFINPASPVFLDGLDVIHADHNAVPGRPTATFASAASRFEHAITQRSPRAAAVKATNRRGGARLRPFRLHRRQKCASLIERSPRERIGRHAAVLLIVRS